jgi:hypothetical protein
MLSILIVLRQLEYISPFSNKQMLHDLIKTLGAQFAARIDSLKGFSLKQNAFFFKDQCFKRDLRFERSTGYDSKSRRLKKKLNAMDK